MENFSYIIEKEEQHKICFGSGCPRDTSRKGMSPFMKSIALEDFPDVAPNSYETLRSFKATRKKPCSKSISKRGYGGIARFGKGIVFHNDNPSPCSYAIPTFPKKVNPSIYPFDSKTERQTIGGNKFPGPGTYVHVSKKGVKFEHSFGGRVKMKLGVDLKCCSQNEDTCRRCGKRPKGDYWHLKNSVFLCKSCMEKEYKNQTQRGRGELKLFRKIRDCSIMHRHEATNARILLMHPNDIAQWLQREAYLSTYLE